MRVHAILRRARRVGLKRTISSTISQVLGSGSAPPKKHVKIDDEERLSDDYQAHPYNRHQRAPLFRLVTMILLIIFILLSTTVFLGYIIYKPPHFVIKFLQARYPDVLFHVELPLALRVVALTLDDAPSSETGEILDLLKKYDAKATFFVIGAQIKFHEDLLQRMIDEGHEIGNHAWKDESSAKLPLVELERQIKEVDAKLPKNRNDAKYFRPGSGFFNKKLVERVKAMGYRVVLGSIYPHDPQIHHARLNSRHVLSMVKPGGIIIMHDRRPYSAKQLELVLKGLTKKGMNGWKIESLGGLLKLAETSRLLSDGR